MASHQVSNCIQRNAEDLLHVRQVRIRRLFAHFAAVIVTVGGHGLAALVVTNFIHIICVSREVIRQGTWAPARCLSSRLY